jgi:eukaryotic-like serine/threonine-protein kinase
MDDAGVIAGHYRLDPAQASPRSVGGLRAFAVIDQRDPAPKLIAVQTRPDLPPRSRLLTARGMAPVDYAMMALDHGPGRDPGGQPAWFIVCPAPPGPALNVLPSQLGETEALRYLLMPAAAALCALAERGLTHRAIRPDNVFRVGPGEAMTLGPCWAAPPGSLQPAAFEPPYSAMCPPAGRGEGGIADDVYALGVLLLWCVLGGAADWSDNLALARRKLEHGSLAALAGGARLSASLQDLLHLMLADEPDHRPTPAVLLEPSQARIRRLATRPPARATRALEIGGENAWSARELAAAIARFPDQGAGLLRSGIVDRWLRRNLGDSGLASRVEECVHRRAVEALSDESRAQAMLVMRAVAVLDPLAPLVWRGVALFPDGLGPLLAWVLASANGPLAVALEELVAQDGLTQWCACQTRRRDVPALKQDARDWRGWLALRGPMGGLKRLLYALNPLLLCGSPLLSGRLAARLTDLLPALEAAAAQADKKRPPIDADIAAFAAARADLALLAELGQIDGFATDPDRAAVLGFFARLQLRTHPMKLPRLAAWLLESGVVPLTRWRSLATRKVLGEALEVHAQAGQIAPMLTLAEDSGARAADRNGAAQATARLEAIATERRLLAADGPRRAAGAERAGQDIAAAAGLAAIIAAGLALALAA